MDIDWDAVDVGMDLPSVRPYKANRRYWAIPKPTTKQFNWRSTPDRPVITLIWDDPERFRWAVIERKDGSRLVTKSAPSVPGHATPDTGWMMVVPPLPPTPTELC